MSTAKSALSRYLNRSFVVFFILNLAVFVVWAFLKRKYGWNSWNYPISYNWDDWQAMSQIRGFEHQIPFAFKNIPQLNAPFTANWNDWPSGDDLMYFVLGTLSRWFGLFFTANLAVVSAHLLAATTFFWSARRLQISSLLSFAGALAFSLSPYLFGRGLQHLILTHAWHLPLIFVFADEFLKSEWPSKWLTKFGLILAFLGGALYVYYTFIFLQVFGFLFLFALARKNKGQVKFLILLIGITLAGAVLGQLDTIFYQFENGPNTLAMTRYLADIELYALKLPDLFFPFQHRWSVWSEWADRRYFSQPQIIRGELGYAYLGIVGIFCFLTVVLQKSVSVFKRASERWSFNEGFLLWMLGFALVGGTNILIAVLTGFNGFRGSNRYSIVIMTLVLLLGLRILSDRLNHRKQILLFPFLLFFVFSDLPVREPWVSDQQRKSQVDSDRTFVSSIESVSAEGSLVFQLPVQDYAESPAVAQMGDYAQFRPFFFSNRIHWSYGSVKGRARESWQHVTERKQPLEMVADLQSYGFSGLMINRTGYKDLAKDLETQLQAQGLTPFVESPNKDLVFYRLVPNSIIRRPTHAPFFEAGWYPPEVAASGGLQYWTEKMGTLVLDNPEVVDKKVSLRFKVFALSPQTISVIGSQQTEVLDYSPSNEIFQKEFTLKPGRNLFRMRSSKRSQKPGNGDPRFLSFCVSDLAVVDKL